MTATPPATVGVLHPGAMGVTIAATCAAGGGADVLWCPTGRSPESVDRAASAGLTGVETLAELVERSDVVVSVCPPGAALDVAAEVATVGFDGVGVADPKTGYPVNPLGKRIFSCKVEREIPKERSTWDIELTRSDTK